MISLKSMIKHNTVAPIDVNQSPFAFDPEINDQCKNETTENVSSLTLTLPTLSQKPVYSFKSTEQTPICVDSTEDCSDSGDSLSDAESWEECASEMDGMWDEIPFEEILSEMMIETQTDEERLLSDRGIYGLCHVSDSLQGSIYRAEASTLSPSGRRCSKRVAIKRVEKSLHAQHVSRDNADGTFDCVEEDVVKEMTLLKRLKGCCTHIVELVDFFESAEHFYLVTEYIDGLTLEQFARKAWQLIESGKLDKAEYLDTAKLIMWQLTRTLQTLHSQHSCCHLDLCLSNIMLKTPFTELADGSTRCSANIECKLLDFGVAEQFSTDFECDKFDLSVDNMIYQSPQSYEGDDAYDARAEDAWQLGLVWYSLMTGFRLYCVEDVMRAQTQQTAYWALQNGKLKEFLHRHQLATDLSTQCLSAIESLLNVDEAERMTLSELLTHPVFADYQKPSLRTGCSTLSQSTTLCANLGSALISAVFAGRV